MGWDYYTYMSQPVFFVDAVRDFLAAQQKAMLEEIKKNKQQHGRR